MLRLVIWCCLCAFCGLSTAATNEQQAQQLRSELLGAQHKTLAIIVKHRGNSAPLNGEHKKLKSLAINSRNLKFGSLSAARVTQYQLEALLSDPTLTVYPDSIKRPLLAQSVQRVYPSQEISPFHGGNQWAVAVLDSGIDKTHPFLAGKVISEACYSDGGGQPLTTSFCPGGVSSSINTNSAAPCSIDGCEHGTQVAGIAVGNGSSFDGVAKDANLISIQVYSRFDGEEFCFPQATCIGAYTSDIIAGLERVYALRNSIDIAAVNVSLGSSELFSGTCDEQPEKAIIDLLRQAKIAVVAAAGNSSNTSMMPSPACISSVISVASTFDNSDIAWINNNTSSALDLFAPGVAITSSVPGGGFATESGTSLAAPHVAGAFAAIRDAAPNLSVQGAENLLKSKGPQITQNAIVRRRLDLTAVLEALVPGSQIAPFNPAQALPAVFLLLLE